MSLAQLCLTKKQLCFDSWWFVQLPSLGSFLQTSPPLPLLRGRLNLTEYAAFFIALALSPPTTTTSSTKNVRLLFPYRRRRWLKPSHQNRYGGWVGTGPRPQDLYICGLLAKDHVTATCDNGFYPTLHLDIALLRRTVEVICLVTVKCERCKVCNGRINDSF